MFYLLIQIEVISHVRLYFLLSLNIALFMNKRSIKNLFKLYVCRVTSSSDCSTKEV
jgi:hypothetical protein